MPFRFAFRLLALCLAVASLSPGLAALAVAAPEPGSEVLSEFYPEYDGVTVGRIEIKGLVRSREAVVRWMLGAREGQPFDAQAWQTGIEHLYKTESVYNFHTQITREQAAGRDSLRIELSLRDKWTIFPYADLEGGGGALAFSFGLYESNLLGTFTNLYGGAGVLNGQVSYEAGLAQKWFLQSPYSVGLEVSRANLPVTFQDSAGNALGSFTWSRTRQYFAFGKQESERLYWTLAFEAYRDGLADPNSTTTRFLYRAKAQYRIFPTVKLWKVSHSDYLEQGHELSLGLIESNPLNPGIEYHAATVAWKQVFFLPDTRNVAYYLSFSHSSPAPLVYQFRLGGFDSVRGFSMNRILGLDSLRANLEYRATLFVYRIPFWDLDRMVMQGCAFTDGGGSWNSAGLDSASGLVTQNGTRLLYSAGFGLRAIFLHFSEATGRLDFAKAIYPGEGYNVSFGVGQFF